MRFSKRATTVPTLTLLCALLTCNGLAIRPALCADAVPQKVNAVPATEGTWKGIDQNLQQLSARIAAGKLDDLGQSAYGIANLVKTLPGQSAPLPAADLSKVSASVKVVGELVTKLDKAGEKGDQAGVDTDLTALQAALNGVRQLYYK
jgi:hypothetical protein